MPLKEKIIHHPHPFDQPPGRQGEIHGVSHVATTLVKGHNRLLAGIMMRIQTTKGGAGNYHV